MKEKDQGRGMAITLAVLAGAAMGAGVALLFAPSSGKETRGWLAHKTRSLRGSTSNALGQGLSAVLRVTDEIGTDGDRAAHLKPPTTLGRV